jgi:ribokinase
MGPAGVLLRMGSQGAYLAIYRLEEQGPSVAARVADTTAAGDALNGAFAVRPMSDRTFIESLRFAVAAAPLSITRPGAQDGMPTLAEVTSILKRTASH